MAEERKPIELDVSKCSLDQKEKILTYAADVRKFEISLLWQRSLFFWGFISVAFGAYAAIAISEKLPEWEKQNLEAVTAAFGFVCSVAWLLQNRGSKYWQEAWEAKIKKVETDVLGTDLFSNWEPRTESRWWGARRFSVSNLLTALSVFTVLVWLSMLLATVPSVREQQWSKWATANVPNLALGGAIGWALLMWWRTKRRDQ